MERTVLITGASSGLGAEMARQFARKGDHLILCARRLENLIALKSEITVSHPQVNVAVYRLDVTDDVQVSTVFTDACAQAGTIDRVIVNAGLGKGRPVGSGKPGANLETATTNVLGVLAQCETALEIFRRQDKGHLILISSVASERGLAGSVTTYAATKAFVSHLGQGLQAELRSSRIKVTVIKPGYIASEMTAQANNSLLLSRTEPAVRAMVKAIEAERRSATVPFFWRPLTKLMKVLPSAIIAKVS